jgi:hypothetical protein
MQSSSAMATFSAPLSGWCGSAAVANTAHASTIASGKQTAANLGDGRRGVRSEVGGEREIAPPLDLGAECGEFCTHSRH